MGRDCTNPKKERLGVEHVREKIGGDYCLKVGIVYFLTCS